MASAWEPGGPLDPATLPFVWTDGGIFEGVLLAMMHSGNGAFFFFDGVNYRGIGEADVVLMRDDARWASEAEIAAGECASQAGLAAVLAHEMGHVLGLGQWAS